MTELDDEDVNGIWYIASTEPDAPWPAHVVEALAAEVLTARGYLTTDVAAAMVHNVDVSSFRHQPMVVVRDSFGAVNDPAEIVIPEFEPGDEGDGYHGDHGS